MMMEVNVEGRNRKDGGNKYGNGRCDNFVEPLLHHHHHHHIHQRLGIGYACSDLTAYSLRLAFARPGTLWLFCISA